MKKRPERNFGKALNSYETITNPLILVNGGPTSVQAPRARSLFGNDAKINFKSNGRIKSIPATWKTLSGNQADWIYTIDLGFPQAPLASFMKLLKKRSKLVFEIGDSIQPLLEGQGKSGLELKLSSYLDRKLPWLADALVFRGSYLYDYFRKLQPNKLLPPSLWLPDGVDTDAFVPLNQSDEIQSLRSQYQLNGKFVVGLVGSIHHNPTHNLFYGWEMVEALAQLPDDSHIVGVIVGDGPGMPVLENAIRKFGMQSRIKCIGRVPHQLVPLWMNLFDVALSTQTDDPVGWGRTTAKLPEYLACGTPVICSDVGEAHRLLADSGQTLVYQGMRDITYPLRLAERIKDWSVRDLSRLRTHNRELALYQFAYPLLKMRLQSFLGNVLNSKLVHGDFQVD